MKRLCRIALLPALVLLAPIFASPDHTSGPPFRMHIVDPQTGRGMSGVTVTSDNGLVCYSDVNGDAQWTEVSVIGRDVRFTFRNPESADEISATLAVTNGGYQEVLLSTR